MYAEYEPKVLDRLHKAELLMLKDFTDLCDKNNIEYFAISGTAIGAVRHKGFIPWDDDIDLALLREDYDRFVVAMKKDKAFRKKYELWGPEEKHKYYNLQPTLMMKDTLFVNENAWAGKFKPGILMDLFIYDKLPADKAKAEMVMDKCTKLKILYITRNVNFFKLLKDKNRTQKVKNIICGFMRLGMMLVPNCSDKLYKKFKRYATMYKDDPSSVYTCLFDPGVKIMHIDKNKSYPTIKVPFEGIEIRLVKNYDEQLKQHMGSYMELPPVEKRTNHAPVELDFGKY